MDGLIRLRWTSHQGSMFSVFDTLLSSESFVDVTLACDGQHIRAHRIILSACSPYFENLLNLDTNKHPIFFLKDVKFAELTTLIKFMYRGEVNVPHAELESLLTVAQALKVRGLAAVELSQNDTAGSEIMVVPNLDTRPNQPTAPPANCPAPAAAAMANSSPNPAATAAPPAAKKPRTDKDKRNAQQTANSLHISSQSSNPTPSGNSPISHCQESVDADALGEHEAYEGQDVKIEAETGVAYAVDLDDDNSHNEEDFGGNWQTFEGYKSDNDTTENSPGSGFYTNMDRGTGTTRPGLSDDDETHHSFKLPRVLDGRRYFKPCETTSFIRKGKVRVMLGGQCVTCGNFYKAENSSNFIRHLRLLHPHLHDEYKRYQPAFPA